MHKVAFFVAFKELRLLFFDLPAVFLDGADGIVVHEGAFGQLARDVAEGDLLLFVAEGKPVATGAFFFSRACSVSEEQRPNGVKIYNPNKF